MAFANDPEGEPDQAPNTARTALAPSEEADMDDTIVAAIRNNPRFIELERRRNAFSWILCAIMLAVYYGFILLVAFAPGQLAKPLDAGGIVTLGFPIGLGVIISAIVLTGIYVARANSRFDQLNAEILREVK